LGEAVFVPEYGSMATGGSLPVIGLARLNPEWNTSCGID